MVEFAPAGNELWQQSFAGDSLNVCWAMRALLDEATANVGYLTRIGHDSFSNRFRSFLADSAIDGSLISEDPQRSMGLYTIETDADGERSFSYWRSDSAARQLANDAGVLRAAFQQANMIYLSGITFAILPEGDRENLFSALGNRGNRGFKVAFDPNIRPGLWSGTAQMQGAIEAAAEISDIVLPTFDDEKAAFGDQNPEVTRSRYASYGVDEIIVKNGVKPTLFQTGSTQGEVHLSQSVKPVDTTGAGDSFNGGYLAGRALGLETPDAIRKGQAVSRVVVGFPGALVEHNVLRKAASDAF